MSIYSSDNSLSDDNNLSSRTSANSLNNLFKSC